MRKIIVFILVLCVFAIFASPTRFSPLQRHNIYGGVIYFRNSSSYNLFWEIDIIDWSKGGFRFDRIAMEKNDIIWRTHRFYVLIADDDKFDRNLADPNIYFKEIRIYDMDTGTLLKEFHTGDEIFTLISGSIEKGAVWEVNTADFFK